MKLRDYLPDFWDGSAEVLAVQDAISPAVAEAWKARDGLLDQLNVKTATWGLALWEKALGLTEDNTIAIEDRRARIIAKLLGQGTATPQALQTLAKNYYAGEVRVLEYPEDYRFEVELSGPLELPVNWEGLKAAIDDIRPAHLAYEYRFIYQTGTVSLSVGFFVHMGDSMTFTMR